MTRWLSSWDIIKIMQTLAGFREKAHIADWELEVWAPNLAALFEQAARGMYAQAGVRLQPAPRQTRRLELSAIDAESLLVRFLEELLYLQSIKGLAFDVFDLQITEYALRAELVGALISSLDKEIKAVTYHKLKIRQGQRGLVVKIVFDV